MSLIVYECQRAGHAHEIRQFGAAAQSLYKYFDGRDETALFIGNVNLGEANLDGLIIKNDAIIIVEFKDYEGSVVARQNGDWSCNGKTIKGGAGGKSVFEQLKKNQRLLRRVIGENNYFTEAQRHDIKGLVVFTKLVSCSDDFDRTNKSWIYISDVDNIGRIMHEVLSSDFKDYRTGRETEVFIPDEDIFSFLRKMKIDESALVTDFTDTAILPQDLFDKDKPHNGKHRSTATLLAQKTEEVASLRSQLEELSKKLEDLNKDHQNQLVQKDLIISQQKVEILQAMTDKLEADKALIEAQTGERSQRPLLNESEPTSEEQRQIDEDFIAGETNKIEQKIEKALTSSQEEHNTPAVAPSVGEKPGKRKFGMKERVLKEFKVREDSLDSEQIGLIERELDKSMIVSGCAGSGKSVIAMYKARQIMEESGSVILITYTKSLDRYMRQGGAAQSADRNFYYHWEWLDAGKPSADYIIVDEIQDFAKEEVDEFIKAARKCYFFFGDTAQSIYEGIKKTLSLKELSNITGIPISHLNSNYRLPKPIAKITQEYVAIEATPYAEAIYQSRETELPHFISFSDEDSQIDAIIGIISKRKMKSVGILVPDNERVLSTMKTLTNRNFICEFKYNAGYNDKRNRDTLDFSTTNPKLMTYHSAKGLQFETVILPFYEGAEGRERRKALYVAMTRTYRFLYVLYTGDLISQPLSDVPKYLYQSNL